MKNRPWAASPWGQETGHHYAIQSVCSPHLQPGPCRQDHGEEKGFRRVLVAAGWAGVCSGMGSEDLVCCCTGLFSSLRRQILVSTLTTTLP